MAYPLPLRENSNASKLSPAKRVPRGDRGMNTYVYRTTVCIGDTDLYGSVYFTHFFRLQGITRELWVREAVQGYEQTMRSGLVLITKSASCEFERKFGAFDDVTVKMDFVEINHASVVVRFRFFKGESEFLHAEGRQKIVFAGPDYRPTRIPANFRCAIMNYLALAEPRLC